MNTTNTQTKSIGYSYPSSPNAQRYNHGKGCFLVEIVEPGIVVKVANTIEEAEEFAATLPYPFNKYSKRK